jgi:hypothetical protein
MANGDLGQCPARIRTLGEAVEYFVWQPVSGTWDGDIIIIDIEVPGQVHGLARVSGVDDSDGHARCLEDGLHLLLPDLLSTARTGMRVHQYPRTLPAGRAGVGTVQKPVNPGANLVVYPVGRLLDRKFRDGKLGMADLNVLRLSLVRIVDQQPPAVAGNFRPKDIVVGYAGWGAVGSWVQCE